MIPGRYQPQVCPHRAALLEAVGIFQGEHEGERRERPDPLHLAQERGFLWVVLLGDRFELSVVSADALGERADRLEDRLESRTQGLRYVLGCPLVEGPCGALGQAMAEGLDRSPNVVDQLTSCVRVPTSASRERIKAM